MKWLQFVSAAGVLLGTSAALAQSREIVLVDTAFTATESTVVIREMASGHERVMATVPHVEGYGAAGNVSPDGRHLAVTVLAEGNRLWRHASVFVVDLASSNTPPRRVLTEAIFAAPVWISNDALLATRSVGEHDAPPEDSLHGRLLDMDLEVVAVTHFGHPNIEVIVRDRANSLELVGLDARGEVIAARNAWEGNSIVAIRPGAAQVRAVALVGSAIPEWTRLSHDGQSVVYSQVVGARGSQTWGVLQIDLDGVGGEVFRAVNEHECAVPTARGIAYTSADGHSLELIAAGDSRSTSLLTDAASDRLVISRANGDGRLFVYDRVGPGGTRNRVYDFATGTSVEVGSGQHWREAMGFRGVR